MLEEAWYWLTLQTSPSAQRLGYRKEAAALRARHRRCRSAWESHLQRTRACLLQSARLACGETAGGSALILGGGLVRDVPWRELLRQFDTIEVIDVVTHPELRAACRASGGRLRVVLADVTGCIERLAKAPLVVPDMARGQHAEPAWKCAPHRWVASVNILSQLPLLPCDWLRVHHATEAVVTRFAQSLLEAHVDGLARAPGGLCIVTETGRPSHATDGTAAASAMYERLLRLGLASRGGQEIDRWQWTLHPPGELPGGETDSREVLGMHFPAVKG